ncbi:hypothetical protein [Streptantibioticus ferralitis]|uniref:Uncharacterized protein n=1 Tax=Streptantibioticus ferralitis TaxID=236510 RepID=A0ABT5Z132_9ACTN|nr:hypothetical protein [Streptantibioticus ferralitis]MDF2256770.1 hypothetical protein [Streptantibioticus ferralitis]
MGKWDSTRVGEKRTGAPDVVVVTIPSALPDVPVAGMLPPPGSVVVYVGDSDAPLWQQLRAAALRGDWRRMTETVAPAVADAGTALIAGSRYFDVRCAGRVLQHDVALPKGVPFRTLSFAYTGGPFSEDDLEIVEHSGQVAEYVATSYVIVRRAPELTEVERQLLDAVGPDQLTIRLAHDEPCGNITTFDVVCEAVGRAAREAVAAKHARAGVASAEALPSLSQEAIGEIVGRPGEPAASMTRLLALRQQLSAR